MQAMMYEMLIRDVYHCGRTGKNGADADIYRAMERAERDLTAKSMFKDDEDREYEFRRTFATVRTNVSNALRKGIEQISRPSSAGAVAKLEEMNKALTLSFYDKERLDEIIEKAGLLFKEHGIGTV